MVLHIHACYDADMHLPEWPGTIQIPLKDLPLEANCETPAWPWCTERCGPEQIVKSSDFELQLQLCTNNLYIYIYACAVVSSLFELQDAQYLRLILYLRMHAKIGEVIKGLENVANEIETVYNGGVVDGFDKKSVS